MSWALVLGGAQCVFDDAKAAITLLGEPDQIVAVKDIWIEWPHVDHLATYHIDRIPNEWPRRQALGYAPPKIVWTYFGIKVGSLKMPPGAEIKHLRIKGGSSGMLGAYVGMTVCDKAVLAGIPLDMNMRHYHMRKKGKPWQEGEVYRAHWVERKSELIGRVTSMSGWTKELLGAPTKEWLNAPIDHGSQEIHPGAGPYKRPAR